MTNKEIRDEAWALLMRDKWFGKALLGFVVFCIVNMIFSQVASLFAHQASISQVSEVADINEAIATSKQLISDFFSRKNLFYFIITIFFSFLMDGLRSLGMSRIFLHASSHDATSTWKDGLFEGFKQPFGVAWLAFRWFIQVWFWIIFALVPCMGAFAAALIEGETKFAYLAAFLLLGFTFVSYYRYRLVWFIKADNPSLGAGECMQESVRLMKGFKRKAFSLDCSFWKIFTLLLLMQFLPMLVFAVMGFTQSQAVKILAGFSILPIFCAMIALLALTAIYWQTAQAIFYREIIKSQSTKAPETICP